MIAPPSDRWLILEQELDRSDWCEEAWGYLIWNKHGLRKGKTGPIGSPEEKEICILFLPESHRSSSFIDYFSHNKSANWNLWCHYGRDLTLADLDRRWNQYNRLSPSDKNKMIADPSQLPLPFSGSMPQNWSIYFETLKAKVKKQSCQLNDSSDDQFNGCLKLLEGAWERAMQSMDAHNTLANEREALPIVVAGLYFLNALPSNEDADTHALMSAFSLFENSSLIPSGNINRSLLSNRVRTAYDQLLSTMNNPIYQSQPCNKEQLKSLRLALIALIAAADL